MSSLWNQKKYLFWPVLFAIYPILAMFSSNVSEINISHINRTLIVSVLFSFGLTLSLSALLRDQVKASCLSIIWLLVFFSYGHIRDLLDEPVIFQATRNEILFPVSVLIMFGGGVWIWKTKAKLIRLYNFFGIMITILTLFVSFSLVKNYLPLPISPDNDASMPAFPLGTSEEKPDIYYIILDGYGQQEILNDIYDYDNSDFINHLTQQGFYIANASHSNYVSTVLSLSSSLNLEYLDKIGMPVLDGRRGRLWLSEKLKHSLVREFLSEQGYQLIAFSNNTLLTINDADVFYNFAVTPRASEIKNTSGLNEFERMFLASTLSRVIFDVGFLPDLSSHQHYLYDYEQINFNLSKLAEVPKLEGNYYIFAHILSPHPPFVFNSLGNFEEPNYPYGLWDGTGFLGTRDDYLTGYHSQAAYISVAVQELIDEILANSNPPPIIIIQGDHGPGAFFDLESLQSTNVNERLGIINAYYFPGDFDTELYPSISPVNSFRVLFNEYFGTNYKLLEDRSYYSTQSAPFNYFDVTEMLTVPVK